MFESQYTQTCKNSFDIPHIESDKQIHKTLNGSMENGENFLLWPLLELTRSCIILQKKKNIPSSIISSAMFIGADFHHWLIIIDNSMHNCKYGTSMDINIYVNCFQFSLSLSPISHSCLSVVAFLFIFTWIFSHEPVWRNFCALTIANFCLFHNRKSNICDEEIFQLSKACYWVA